MQLRTPVPVSKEQNCTSKRTWTAKTQTVGDVSKQEIQTTGAPLLRTADGLLRVRCGARSTDHVKLMCLV